jgi:hypothetical protein
MQYFTTAQLLHPGNISYDDERRKKMERYEKAVKRAQFLSEREKRNWLLLGHMLSKQQLLEAEKLIINEDLRLLNVRQQLEKIKPVKDKRNG